MNQTFSFFRLVVIAFTCISSYAFSLVDKREGMLRDVETIRGLFEDHYAPAEWKKKSLDWDLDSEIEKVKTAILKNESLTIKEFQQLLLDLFNSPKDHHVQIVFHSTESAKLPFRVKSAEGRYFFVDIDESQLSPRMYPIEEGDELVLFDGLPVKETIEKIKRYQRGCNPATEDAFAEMHLTMRAGDFGHSVPKGPIQIQVAHASTGMVSNYQLIWDYVSEKISSRFGPREDEREDAPAIKLTPLLDHSFFRKAMVAPIYQVWNEKFAHKEGKHLMGGKRSFVPKLGKLWWTGPETSQFDAYLFETEDFKRIGYLRIPYYMGSRTALRDFASTINFFEARADALIIDQVDNPGGSLFYLYALASMLTDQPLVTPKHRMKISQTELFFAHLAIPLLESVRDDEDAQDILGVSYEGNEVNFQMAKFFLNYMYFLVDEWNAGRQFTNPTYLEGVDHIHPHPTTRFTKPILFLINEMDLSGGDFLPAILQDNKRAVIFGERTGGAGGFLSRSAFPNLNGIAYIQITGSIAERADFSPLESLGVTPDIPYSLTAEDLQYGYQGYKNAVLDALETLF